MHTPPRETYYDDRILTNGVLLALAAQFVSTAVIVACHAIEFSFLVDRRAGGGLAVPSPEGTLFETIHAFLGVVDLTQPAFVS